MATASALMAQVQAELGDPNADTQNGKFTSSVIYGWLDEGQKEWCVKLMPLIGINSQAVVTNQDSVALPTDCIMIDAISSRRGWLRKVQAIGITDWLNQQSAVRTALSTDPAMFTEIDQRAYVFPRYSGSSLVSLLNASTATADTTFTLASTDNLTSYGRAKINAAEVIEYTGKTSTTLTGVRRGLENTSAIAYASGASVAQCDYIAYYRRYPLALASTATPEIKAAYHEKLKAYAKYAGYMMEGSFDKAQAQLGIWQASLNDAEYAEKKKYLMMDRVRDMDTQTVSNLYGPV